MLKSLLIKCFWLSSISFLWADLQWGLVTQVVQVQEGMFHVKHQQRKGVSERHKAEKEKIVVEI